MEDAAGRWHVSAKGEDRHRLAPGSKTIYHSLPSFHFILGSPSALSPMDAMTSLESENELRLSLRESNPSSARPFCFSLAYLSLHSFNSEEKASKGFARGRYGLSSGDSETAKSIRIVGVGREGVVDSDAKRRSR